MRRQFLRHAVGKDPSPAHIVVLSGANHLTQAAIFGAYRWSQALAHLLALPFRLSVLPGWAWSQTVACNCSLPSWPSALPTCALGPRGLPTYGGQAVLEGVMMRGQRFMTVAVRAPSDEIILKVDRLPARLYGGRIARLPLIRGTIGLWDALGLGMRALMFSADVALAEPGQETEPAPKGNQAFLGIVSAIGLIAGVGFFFLLPASVTTMFHAQFGNALVSNVFEGVLRAGLLVGYLALIGLMPDMRRVFMYHGAEHKAINAFEAGAELEAAGASRFGLRHPRCGTNFLLIVAVMSIAIFALLGRPDSWLILLGSRVVLIPVIAGLAYEAIRWGATRIDQPFVRLIMAPGLALQGLSTREPDLSQVEVAVHALKELLRLERGGAVADSPSA